jgi:hypothetical protein
MIKTIKDDEKVWSEHPLPDVATLLKKNMNPIPMVYATCIDKSKFPLTARMTNINENLTDNLRDYINNNNFEKKAMDKVIEVMYLLDEHILKKCINKDL